jgi:transaldolase
MTTVWKKAEETVETAPDTGDLLAPLRRVYGKYIEHRARILCKATNQNREVTAKEARGCDYYLACAESVKALINQ